MIDWTKPIETVPCERNPKPVPCRLLHGFRDRVIIEGFWVDKDGNDEQGWDWRVTKNGKFDSIDGSVRNVATTENPLPEPTATWWARRWYDSASPDEREAMRVILAGEV